MQLISLLSTAYTQFTATFYVLMVCMNMFSLNVKCVTLLKFVTYVSANVDFVYKDECKEI